LWCSYASHRFIVLRAMTTTNLKPGSFCWMELGTSDQQAAKKFYSDLFGWTVTDSPMGPGEVYTIFKLDGKDVAAGYTLRPDQRQMGVPPHWMLYIACENADGSAKRATELGGTVLAGPFDVMDAGRMAVVKDPAGAVFCLWEAKSSSGVSAYGVDNAFCWADLMTRDVVRSAEFYAQLFGWKWDKGEKDDSGYLHIKNGDDFIGGMPPAEHLPPGAPPHWQLYFQTSDCDATVAKAKQLGAKVYFGPISMEGVGRFAVVADPQGAAFSVFQSARK
jgi:predicted enzyme related to lactoylglutathione lyase